jgi:hypothetical protein
MDGSYCGLLSFSDDDTPFQPSRHSSIQSQQASEAIEPAATDNENDGIVLACSQRLSH